MIIIMVCSRFCTRLIFKMFKSLPNKTQPTTSYCAHDMSSLLWCIIFGNINIDDDDKYVTTNM